MSAPKRKEGPDSPGGAAAEDAAVAGRGAGSYVREWVNCGSPYCRTCAAGGQGTHGPYWYLYLWCDGRHRKRYIGKILPQSAGPAPAGQDGAQPGGQAPT